MNLTTRARVALAAALLTGASVSVPIVLVETAAAASVGRVFVTPNPGDQDSFFDLQTDGPCPTGTEAIKAKVTGPGVPDNGQNNVVGNTDYTILDHGSDGSFSVSAVKTLKQVFLKLGVTAQDADYGLTIICQSGDGSTVFGTLDATVHLTPNADGFKVAQASQAAATTTTLAVSPASPVSSDTTTTLTATITPSTAAGTVQFKRGTTNLGAPVAVRNGTASFAIKIAAGRSDVSAAFVPTNPNLDAPSTSAAQPYTVLDAPTLTGTPAVDATLTCASAAVGDRAYAWLVDGTPASGVTTASVRPPASWVGRPVRCQVTTSADGGSVRLQSDSVTIATGAALKAITKPSISGVAKVGRSLACRPGAWSPKASSYAYQWLRSGQRITGATRSAYKVVKSDRGRALSCRVTAKAAGHRNGVATTKAVKAS